MPSGDRDIDPINIRNNTNTKEEEKNDPAGTGWVGVGRGS